MKKILFTFFLLFSLPLIAQKAVKDEIDHKLVTYENHSLDYKNFTLPTSVEGKKIDLREFTKGKKLVLVTYFAAWCDNSNHDYETINYLLKKFGDKGLAVIGICNYSAEQEVKDFIKTHQPLYPICIENSDEKAREKSTHFMYRKQCGDTRKWGTPFSLLIETKKMKPDGEILATEVQSAAGEMDRKEAEKLIKKLLK
jgi:peroxiredoxin